MVGGYGRYGWEKMTLEERVLLISVMFVSLLRKT